MLVGERVSFKCPLTGVSLVAEVVEQVWATVDRVRLANIRPARPGFEGHWFPVSAVRLAEDKSA